MGKTLLAALQWGVSESFSELKFKLIFFLPCLIIVVYCRVENLRNLEFTGKWTGLTQVV